MWFSMCVRAVLKNKNKLKVKAKVTEKDKGFLIA